jgi:rubredoxin
MTKVMKIVDATTGKMQCKNCGATHFGQIKSGTGKFYRSNWKCPNGCTAEAGQTCSAHILKIKKKGEGK